MSLLMIVFKNFEL